MTEYDYDWNYWENWIESDKQIEYIKKERARINHRQETFFGILFFLFVLLLGGCGLYIFS